MENVVFSRSLYSPADDDFASWAVLRKYEAIVPDFVITIILIKLIHKMNRFEEQIHGNFLGSSDVQKMFFLMYVVQVRYFSPYPFN